MWLRRRLCQQSKVMEAKNLSLGCRTQMKRTGRSDAHPSSQGYSGREESLRVADQLAYSVCMMNSRQRETIQR